MKAGVLFPLSSFPSDFGIGDFGKNAYQTIDLLKQNGADYLQILPFHPSYQANSPYRAISTYAGDEIYIDLNQLVDMNLLNDVYNIGGFLSNQKDNVYFVPMKREKNCV